MDRMKNFLMLGLLALILAGCAGSTSGIVMGTAGDVPASGTTWGPATSVPQTYMTENGDRRGHFAPYFFPDGPGGGNNR